MPPAVRAINLRIEIYGNEERRLQSSDVVRSARPVEILNLIAPLVTRVSGPRSLEGRVVFDNGLPAAELLLLLYRVDVGGKETKLLETTTTKLGVYAFPPFDLDGKIAGLQVRAFDGKELEQPLSKIIYDLGDEPRIIVNLVAQTAFKPPAAEYDRLQSDLGHHIGDLKGLRNASENFERRDLTMLNRETGWDARLIALAANAERLSADGDIVLPGEALYGMLRTGLPSDKQSLARCLISEVKASLKQAKDANIIGLTENQLGDAVTNFEIFARKSFRSSIAPGALSNFGELLEKSRLDEAEKRRFEDVCFTQRGSADELWKAAHAVGLSEKQVDDLRLQGKLAFLTLYNAELTADLQEEISSPRNLGQLVQLNLYRDDAWKSRITKLASGSNKRLENLIPPVYEAEEVEERLNAYAVDLARKIRLSFPTRVVEQMIVNDELMLGSNHAALKQPVASFLRNAEPLGFEFGVTPLEPFVRENTQTVLSDIATSQREPTLKSLQRLARLYQITPSDEALRVLAASHIDSAYDIATFTEEEFLAEYGNRFPSHEEAKLIVRQAQQVSAVVYNVLAAAKQLDSAPALYALSPSAEQRDDARKNLIKRYPSMESLFGS
ncbi:MAG TPA: hypothetical protein VIT23_17975, partial [Terrimicrobiaceae bacterium]